MLIEEGVNLEQQLIINRVASYLGQTSLNFGFELLLLFGLIKSAWELIFSFLNFASELLNKHLQDNIVGDFAF